jgi:hypothetical protein
MLVSQMKDEFLMLVPENADDFCDTVGALQSLGDSEGVSFHISLPEDRCVRLLLNNLGIRMTEADFREEVEALHIHVQAPVQLRLRRRDLDAEKDHPLTTTFHSVGVARP